MPRQADKRSPRARANAAIDKSIADLLARWKFHLSPGAPPIPAAAKQIRRDAIKTYRRFMR